MIMTTVCIVRRNKDLEHMGSQGAHLWCKFDLFRVFGALVYGSCILYSGLGTVSPLEQYLKLAQQPQRGLL